MDLTRISIKEISALLDRKEISSKELTESFFKRINDVDPKIKAFLTKTFDLARKQAEEADARIAVGERLSPLDGVPCAIKDNISTKGIRTTAASKILENYIPPYDATVIEKLKSRGMVMLGKTNLDEFAMGSSTENSAFGPTHNPWSLGRVPGGSSGGSAAAVAADECVYALGSDTGGSIRQPASFCGVVGLKPTYGRVSRYGLLAMGSSLDQIGPLTKSVEDAAIVLEAISGKDQNDATAVGKIESFSKLILQNPGKIKLAILDLSEIKDFKPSNVYQETVRVLEENFGKLEPIKIPLLKYAVAVYYVLMASEVSSNLERYDGIKYGLSDREGRDLLDIYFSSRAKGFGAEVKRRIMLGTYSLSAGFYDAYYKKAAQVRRLIKDGFDKIFKSFDLLIMPTSPTTAFKIGERVEDPLTMYLSDIFTIPINLAGVPAISIPCGFDEGGLPESIQIVGPYWSEAKILQVAHLYEQLTKDEGWRKKKPRI